jgi:hypothetical protein
MKREAPEAPCADDGFAGSLARHDRRWRMLSGTITALEAALELSDQRDDLLNWHARRLREFNPSHSGWVKVTLQYSAKNHHLECVIRHALFPSATDGQVVPMGVDAAMQDAMDFVADMENYNRAAEGHSRLGGHSCMTAPWAWRVFAGLGYVHLDDVYALNAECRALQLRCLQAKHGAWPLANLVNVWTLSEVTGDRAPRHGEVFAPLSDDGTKNPFRYLGRTWPVRDRVTTPEAFARLVDAWRESVPDLTPPETWALIGSALGFARPMQRIMVNVVVVRLEAGCAAADRFRAVIPAKVFALCGATAPWPAPADVPFPMFVPGGTVLGMDSSTADRFDLLEVLPGLQVPAVVAGGLVASVMSTHWAGGAGGVPACAPDCRCRLARDVDVMTTNKAHAGVVAALEGVPGVDVTQTPFASVQRLLTAFDFTHNQGAVVAHPGGDLWVVATADAYLAWATMHTRWTGSAFTARRVTLAQSKGFTVDTFGREADVPPPGLDEVLGKSKVAWGDTPAPSAGSDDKPVKSKVAE